MTLRIKSTNSKINKMKIRLLFDAKEISKLLQHIFHDIKHIEKSRLKALYLSVIDRIDIKKMVIIKTILCHLKLNNEIIKTTFQ